MPDARSDVRRGFVLTRVLVLGLLVTFWLLGLAGCRPAFQQTGQAQPLPLSKRDPREDGRQLARWPGWRGPDNSAVARGGAPPVKFSHKQGFRFKVDVPGSGLSSPVVWHNFILLTTALDKTDPPTLAVLCFNREDGSQLWQTEVGQAVGPTHVKNGYASATVATDGRRIFAFFGTTGLFALDFTGDVLWRADLGTLDHQWGTAASPVLYGDTVIQLCDSETQSYLAAFDQDDGELRWRADRGGNGCWSTPKLIEAETDSGLRDELVVNGSGVEGSEGCIIAYDPASGTELWRVRGTTQYVTPTPLSCGGLVVCASGRNGPVTAIRPGGSGDVTDSRVAWKHHYGGPYIPSGVAYRNRLFIIGDDGTLACYNAGSGERVWSKRLSGPVTASLVAADGRIYAVTERGRGYVAAADDKFKLLAQNELRAKCLTTPAVADGELLIRTHRHLYCFAAQEPAAASPPDDGTPPGARAPEGPPAAPPSETAPIDPPPSETPPDPGPLSADPPAPVTATKDSWALFRGDPASTGVAVSSLPEKPELLWQFTDDDGGFEATAAIADGTVFVGSLDGHLYAIDLETGEQRWKLESDLGFKAAPAVRDGRVYIGDVDGLFRAVDAKTGRELWKHQTDAEINAGANFYGDNVVVGSQDAVLYCLKCETGEVVWQADAEDQIRCMPTIVGDTSFVSGCNAKLNVVDLTQGKLVSGVDLAAPTLCTPAVVGPIAYVGTDGGTFFAVDWKASKIAWTYENRARPSPFWSSAAVSGDLVVVGSRDKMVHALNRQTGGPVWAFSAKRNVDSSPVVVGDRVYVGSDDGRLYGLKLATGQEVWRFEAGGRIAASPAVASRRLVIGNDEGVLYCLGKREK
jgi:outer membrane protein assembly factor BamB